MSGNIRQQAINLNCHRIKTISQFGKFITGLNINTGFEFALPNLTSGCDQLIDRFGIITRQQESRAQRDYNYKYSNFDNSIENLLENIVQMAQINARTHDCYGLSLLASGSAEQALGEFRRVLRPGGRVLLRLPAHDWLRGSHDAVIHTARRFTTRNIAQSLHEAGFVVERLSYANTLLFPLALGKRLLERTTPSGPLARSDVAPASAASGEVGVTSTTNGAWSASLPRRSPLSLRDGPDVTRSPTWVGASTASMVPRCACAST